jgi:hypothetical protein
VFPALSLCDTQLVSGSTFIDSDGGSSPKDQNLREVFSEDFEPLGPPGATGREA